MDKPAASGRYAIPWRANLLVIAAQIAATAAILVGAAMATAWWQVAGLAVAFAVVGNSIYAIIHEAEHRMLHPSAAVNDALGVAMALLFPAPFHLIRQGHIGHHLRNRSDDEAFDLWFDGESPTLKRMQLYGILTGFYYLMVVASNVVVLAAPWVLRRRVFGFDRPTAALLDSLNPRYAWAIRGEAAAAIGLHTAIVLGLGVPIAHYLAIYGGFGLAWSAMQYVHHFGTERHVLDGTRDLRTIGWLDAVWLNHNWHRAHHRNPTVPWVYLPQLSDPRNTGDGEADGTDPRESLLVHYARMWRGPRRATDHVENKYAGRVIR